MDNNEYFKALYNMKLSAKLKLIPRNVISELICYNFANALTLAYFCDKELNVIFINEKLAQEFKLEKSEIIGKKTISELFKMMDIKKSKIHSIEKKIEKDGKAYIPSIQAETKGGVKNFRLFTTRTSFQGIKELEGLQGQFIERGDADTINGLKDELEEEIRRHPKADKDLIKSIELIIRNYY